LDQELAGVGQEDPYRQPVGWLRCFRGIDTVTAVTLVAELFGIERFDSPRQLMSYLGLTPSEDSTGDKVRKGPITKAGNRRVRRLLVEASWHQTQLPRVGKALAARRREQPLWAITLADRAMRRLHRRYWHLVHKGKSPSKAVTAVARELVGFVWAGLRLQGGSVGGDPRRGRVRSGARSRRSGVAASPRAPLRGDPPDAEAVPAGPPARPRPGEEAKPAERLTPGQEMKAFFARGRKS
jgi:hypothetical protein